MIRCEDVGVRYGDFVAVDRVTLDVPVGEVTAIVGPSGCGKSSVLAALNRMTDLVPGARVSGRITFDGVDVLDPATDVVALRRRMGLVLQTPTPFPLSIARNLELPLREHGIRDPGRVEEALREVGLWDEVRDRLDTDATSLSGGQQQRLCLARALALRPEALLLDEPCSALDPLASAVVEERIAALRGRYTIVIVTHNLAQARRLADHVAVFWLVDGVGQRIESGPASDMFARPSHPLTAMYLSGEQG